MAEECSERLAQLVHLDAFIARDGQALIDLFPPEVAANMRERTLQEGGG
ncbi:MAG TPA: hypothetical protein VLD65_10120 [Anaerolineales bacterium]|nr:hypothetical protein [Anaerolineales bacterium]